MKRGTTRLLFLTAVISWGWILSSCTVVSTVGVTAYTAATLESRASVSSLVRDNTAPSYMDFSYEIFSMIPSGSRVFVAPVRVETNDGQGQSRYDSYAMNITKSFFNNRYYGSVVGSIDDAEYVALVSAKETVSSYRATLSHVDVKVIDKRDQVVVFQSSIIARSVKDQGYYTDFSTPARDAESLSYAGLNKILNDGVVNLLQ